MNGSTIIVLVILAVILFFAIRAIVRTKKKGGCVGCSGCSTGEGCHSKTENKIKDLK